MLVCLCGATRVRVRAITATLGQNWGFPTYNWDEMAKNECVGGRNTDCSASGRASRVVVRGCCWYVARGDVARVRYKWWKQRLTQMSSYFHAYRIDHILGFFRIWQIPAHGVTGLLGALV